MAHQKMFGPLIGTLALLLAGCWPAAVLRPKNPMISHPDRRTRR